MLYAVGALLAIGELISTRSSRPALAHWITILAFSLFVCTSTLFFVNARLPKEQANVAGELRLTAAACLFSAVVLLFGLTLTEVRTLEP